MIDAGMAKAQLITGVVPTDSASNTHHSPRNSCESIRFESTFHMPELNSLVWSQWRHPNNGIEWARCRSQRPPLSERLPQLAVVTYPADDLGGPPARTKLVPIDPEGLVLAKDGSF